MEITQQFEVAHPVDAVWALFKDVPLMASCMPGVELTEEIDSSTVRGRMNVVLGPMRPVFEGEAKIEQDDSSHEGTIHAKGVDKKGGSRAEAAVSFAVAKANGSSKVRIVAQIKLFGKLAQFGRAGILRDVSEQLTGDFSRCLEAKLEAATPEEAAEITGGEVRPFGLVLAAVWSRIVSFLRKLFGSMRQGGSDD